MAKEEKLADDSGAESGASKTAEKSTWQLQREVDDLTERVDVLKAQMALPLTGGDITMMRGLLAEQKTKAGDRDRRSHEDDLLDKLDGYLNPPLQFEPITTLPLDGE